MSTADQLLRRIRGEYQEMPGLRLTFPQACRLWDMDGTTCLALLDQLVVERFLHRTPDGAYLALPRTRPTPAKAALPVTHATHVHTRRSA